MRVFVIGAAVAVGMLACLHRGPIRPGEPESDTTDSVAEEEAPEWLEEPAGFSATDGTGQRHRDDSGGMGTSENRFGIEGPSNHPAGQAGDPMAALGALMGDRPGRSTAERMAGLGLRGTGRGAGGLSAGIGTLSARGVLASTFVGGRGAEKRLSDLLDRGVTVDGGQVRLGAFEDRAHLSYPLPSEGAVGLHAELERGLLHAGDDRVHLQVALTARRGERPPRPRLDVRVLLDASGSMANGAKWPQALAATEALVRALLPGDRFGLITYADRAEPVVPPRRGPGREGPVKVIRSLRSGGATNLEAALDVLEANPPRRRGVDDVALVVVISDGMITEGEANPAVLGGRLRRLFDRGGVVTTTIGLGDEFDEELMLTLAREGAGSYHFVRDAGDIAEALDDELEAHLTSVAQALRLRIELPEGVGLTRVYGSRLLDGAEQMAVRQSERVTDCACRPVRA